MTTEERVMKDHQILDPSLQYVTKLDDGGVLRQSEGGRDLEVLV